MGADMLLIMVSFPLNVDLVKEQEKLVEYVKSMSKEQIEEFLEQQTGQLLDEEEDLEGNRKTIIELVREGFNALSWRCVADFYRDNDWIFATGGLSWGDDPTEAFTPLCNLSFLLESMRTNQ